MHYKANENSGISNQWFLDFVVPNIRSNYCESFFTHLGRALLWLIFNPTESANVPVMISNWVKKAYGELSNNRLGADTNPVSKVALLVSGDDAEVFIDVLLENPADN